MASCLDNKKYARSNYSFFLVREDHDAIGALESSVENRKYYAKQSIKYKSIYVALFVNY